jgi:hypothetical protein
MSNYATPAQPKAPMTEERRGQLLGYVAGVLGLLSFIWGFLDWYSGGGDSVGGYTVVSGGAAASIGLSLAAGLLAAGLAFEKRPQSLTPAALAVASLLVVFGIMVDHDPGNSGVNVSAGLILQLISALLQAAALVFAWLSAIGRVPAPRPKPVAQQQWGPQSYQQTAAQQQGYQQPPAQQQPGYQPQPPPGGYAPPAGYQPPQQQPGYQPQRQPPAQQPPAQQPPGYQPPQQQPPNYQPPTEQIPTQGSPPAGQHGQQQPPPSGYQQG